MTRIRTDGLLTNSERQTNKVQASGFNGALFGDGVYLGNNPYSYHNFGGGDQGLLVARLKGVVQISQNENTIHKRTSDNQDHSDADTVLGRAGDTDEVCVLRSSSQCVALVQYSSSLVDLNDDDSVGNKLVYEYHQSIQDIVDECFNNGAKTEVVPLLPSEVTIRTLLTAKAALQRTITLLSHTLQEMIFYTAPEKVKEDLSFPNQDAVLQNMLVDSPTAENCIVCKESLRNGATTVGRLPRCSHEMHGNCIAALLQRHSRKCPRCGMAIGQLQGSLPKETLWVDPKNNPMPLVVLYKPDNKVECAGKKRSPHSKFSYVVTFLTDKNRDRNSECPPKFAFACGASFDMIFSTKDKDTGQDILLSWSEVFDSPVILERIRKCAEKHCKKCFSCRKAFGKLQKKIPVGVMPTGTMRIDLFPNISCSGCDDPGTIVISIPIRKRNTKELSGESRAAHSSNLSSGISSQQ